MGSSIGKTGLTRSIDSRSLGRWPPVARSTVDDLVVHRSDGQRTHMRAQATPLRDAAGQIAHVVVAFTDISEEVRANEARRSVEHRLAFAVANAPVALWMIDRDGRITLSEGAALQAMGFVPGELVGQLVFELYRDYPAVLANTRRALSGEVVVDYTDLPGLRLMSTLKPLRDRSGEVVGAIGVATDVTESRRLEERLGMAQKMEAVGRLAGGVAHDFNNLLGVIQGFAWVCQERLGAADPSRPDLDQIAAACERGARLVKQLLAFSREQSVRPEVVDVAALVAQLEQMLARVAGRELQLKLRLHPEAGRVNVDAGRLEQALMNLVINARDAMAGQVGGILTIEVATTTVAGDLPRRQLEGTPGECVMIAVSDTGTGMDEETRRRMFEPFFTTKGAGGGTGLGLSTVYGFVKQCRGHITVTSEPGMGTTVAMYLPRTELLPTAAQAIPVSSPRQRGTETVLVVEDDRLLREMVSEILQSSGYQVLAAASGDEALAVSRSHPDPIQLLLTDVVLPGASGIEVATAVKALRPDIRLALMSGYSAETMGALPGLPAHTLVVEKPFAPRTLLSSIRDLLDSPTK